MSQHPADDQDVPEDDAPLSKTAQKRNMLALQKTGEALIDLPPKQYNALDLPETLREAVDAARLMTKRGALHRQKQFIGKVMRNIDAAPIEAALERLEQQDRTAARQFHRVEHWRDRLLDEDDKSAATELCNHFPDIDRQPLGQKIRAARREATTGRPAGAKRSLFRFISAAITRAADAAS
ncbi:MAG: ribosome biogenesis factor YjgA [Gammaproteobacteria bacterium]